MKLRDIKGRASAPRKVNVLADVRARRDAELADLAHDIWKKDALAKVAAQADADAAFADLVYGMELLPHAHKLARRLLRIAADIERPEAEVDLLYDAALLLLALPGPPGKRGPRPKPETAELKQLAAELKSKRKAALVMAGKTGKPVDVFRRRLRPKP